MSSDLAQALLCVAFTGPAVALLVFSLVRKNIGGSDAENSEPIFEDRESIQESATSLTTTRRLSVLSITVCLVLITVLTVVTLIAAGHPVGTSSGKCPLGF